MKINKPFAIIYTVVIFSMGAVFAFIMTMKSQMDAVIKPKTITTNQSVLTTQPKTNKQYSHVQTLVHECEKVVNSNNKNIGFKKIALNDYSASEAKSIIDNMPDVVLSEYVDKFMAKGDSNIIDNKREFAQRAVEELYKPNDNTLLTGEIKLALSSKTPEKSMDTNTLPKNAKLYAHLNTFGKSPKSPYVFVKWVDNTTGQLLLFEKKNVVASRDTNWVNMKPYDGWHVGSYDIKFFQFTSKLQPIAQLTYTIHEITE